MTPVRLEPAAPRSRVNPSTTEPLRSLSVILVSTKPTINLKEIGLKHASVSTLFLPDPSTTGKLWTKVMDWETIDVKAGAVYSFEPGSPPSYITNIEIGITDVDVNLILKRGNVFKTLCILGTFSCFIVVC